MTQLAVLIAEWRDGDTHAADRLYDLHKARAYRLAYGLLGDEMDAEEVAQEALQYALSNIDKFDATRSQFTTWLHTITVSRARNKRRRKWLPSVSLQKLMQSGGDIVDRTPRPEQAVEHGELWQQVQALEPKLREVVLLRYWLGHSYREVSEIVGCPLGTAQSRVQRALQILRARIGAEMANFEVG